ncbi:hypothetical protein JEZ13_05720 [bacterium]|nr:hypothetical protein [bacterium]
MKYLLLVVIIVSTLLFTGCDDRGTENPKMRVWAESDYGNFVYNKVGFNVMTFHIQLDGPLSKIIERKVNVNNQDDLGYFIGSGNSFYLITDENGYAQGRFVAEAEYGATDLEFVLDNWQSERETFPIPIYDFPVIDSLVAGSYTLNADGISSTTVTAYVSSANMDFDDSENIINILFEATDGSISPATNPVNASGISASTFVAPTQASNVTVKARLELHPPISESISISCVNP